MHRVLNTKCLSRNVCKTLSEVESVDLYGISNLSLDTKVPSSASYLVSKLLLAFWPHQVWVGACLSQGKATSVFSSLSLVVIEV